MDYAQLQYIVKVTQTMLSAYIIIFIVNIHQNINFAYKKHDLSFHKKTQIHFYILSFEVEARKLDDIAYGLFQH